MTKADKDAILEILTTIKEEADREARAIGASARRGDQSKADTFRFIREMAAKAITIMGKL